jgi:NADPH-dependent glutamate synthase beta subunit-like oxidoreductase/Pyruvate/2-oxoacid:ferredoxin oxidoreductase delta subunit
VAKVYIRGAGIHAAGTIAMVNKTGSWRYFRPVHEEKMPPCNNACPAGNNIQGFIKLIREEKFLDAWKLIKETSPLPGVCGRVCPHPCEKECNRGKYDEAMAIHTLERLVADYAINEKVTEKSKAAPKKEKIAIVGSGPAGLSCAYFLAKDGYPVTVFEALPEIGGMLRVGIPKYRLPRKTLDKEIADIKALGVTFKTNAKIKDINELKDYDAVFVGTGAHVSRKLDVPGENVAGVISGTEFLRQLNLDGKAKIGKNVIVVGGGNTAIDAARSAVRLGSKATIVYRRTRDEMPAVEEETEAASKEKIEIVYLAAPTKIIAQDGKIKEVEFVRMKLGAPDASGRKKPIPIEGSTFKMKADTVITAIGESSDLSLLPRDFKLAEKGAKARGIQVFGGGDAVTGSGRVVDAIASSRRAARFIGNALQGTPVEEKQAKELAKYEEINTAYFPRQAAVRPPELSVAKRTTNFSEINRGIPEGKGLKEAKRCFSCGVCRECDNCSYFCPDICVSKKNGTYEFDYDYCKGCGICSHECCAGVIRMVQEAQ